LTLTIGMTSPFSVYSAVESQLKYQTPAQAPIKKFWIYKFSTYAHTFSPAKITKIFFWCGLQKERSSCVFLQRLGTMFWSPTTLCAIFDQNFMDFVKIFRDFAWIFRDFAQIFKGFAQTIGILSGFSTNQNFQECACSPYNRAIYISVTSENWKLQLYLCKCIIIRACTSFEISRNDMFDG